MLKHLRIPICNTCYHRCSVYINLETRSWVRVYLIVTWHVFQIWVEVNDYFDKLVMYVVIGKEGQRSILNYLTSPIVIAYHHKLVR